MMVASRGYFISASDDFINYYQTFQDLSRGDLSSLLKYRGGFEIGLPVVYLIIAWTGLSDPSFVLFAQTLVLLWLFSVWLERQKALRSAHGVLIAGCALFFFSIGLANQLTRQMYSSVVLLYAFSARTKSSRGVFLLLSAMFHVTALGVYALFVLASRLRYKLAIVLAVAVVPTSLFFEQIVRGIVNSSLPGWIRYSSFLQYYMATDFARSIIAFRLVATLGLLCALVLLREYRIYRGGIVDSRFPSWMGPFVVSMLIIVIGLLPVPLAPLRVSLIVAQVLVGYLFASLFVELWPAKYLAFAMVAYSVYRAFSVSDAFGRTAYWYSYNAVLQYPGQFIEIWFR